MKSSGGGGGGGGGGFPSGPRLTPKQKAERDRKEAAKARKESGHARTEAGGAREEAAHARGEARHEEQLARKDIKEGFTTEAKRDEARAGRDLARARRDDARADRDVARSKRDAARGRRDMGRARTAGLARAGRPGGWILGGNDRHESCAATAVANALLLATGHRAADDDVLRLWWHSGGSVIGALESADLLHHGQGRLGFQRAGGCGILAGHVARPGDKFILGRDGVTRDTSAGFGQQPAGDLCAGREARVGPAVLPVGHAPIVLELDLQQAQREQGAWDWEPSPPWGVHAAVLAGGHLITWGRAVPVTEAFLDEQVTAAYAITGGV